MSLINYFKETKGEMKHVSWPTRRQSVNFTILVISISILTALLLGFFDFVFSLGLEKVIENGSYESAFPQATTTDPFSTSTAPIATSSIDFDLSL